jgi:hypothetical protein
MVTRGCRKGPDRRGLATNRAPPDRRLNVGECDTNLQGIGLLEAHAGEYAATGDDFQPIKPS